VKIHCFGWFGGVAAYFIRSVLVCVWYTVWNETEPIYRSGTKVICWHRIQKYHISEEKMNNGIRHWSPILTAVKFLSIIPYTNPSDHEEPYRA
jgi:hypothetical protein